MNPEELLNLVQSGDLTGLDALAECNGLESVPPDVKNLLTRTAARAGQSAVLRHLFEHLHLYGTDPDGQGRTVLHFAAMSGDRETLRFALDVLGFDPLAGDARGKTALDYAAEAPRPEAYAFLTERLGFSPEDCYRNPVLRGFHPDPSVVRVEEDYYLVNSSFVFFPGLPVFHSWDLVSWELVGHAVENLEASGLADLPGGFGYWAPDISYFQGRFWVVATLRRNTPPYRLQMITSAADPRGPWDAPRFLPLDGIDPSLFTDDDGRRYILLNPGAILAEISGDGELISRPEMIYFGSARIKPEGPHLLKKDGWYYLFLAEGGTGEGHMETVLRSKNLKGPYEDCPFNPILSRKNPLSPIQRSGHGKPVSTPDGRWYMVYLCSRPVDGKTVMGRETALDPLLWTKDGWPMVNGLKGPSCLQKRPEPERTSGCGDNAEWIAPRRDPLSFAQIGDSRIILQCGGDPARIGPCSLLLRRQTEADFTQTVHVDMREAEAGDLAGITGYYDERSFFLFGLEKTGTGCILRLIEQIGDSRREKTFSRVPSPEAALLVRTEGLLRTLCVQEEDEIHPIASLRTEYLCDEGVTGGKRFTGALCGLAAVGRGRASFRGFSFQFLRERNAD
ncbi:MAG: family 43 glycosylhydrolase [Clostridia bacterium]|nr:family 43 glycosylhydrolase [Clostridia bacterium]